MAFIGDDGGSLARSGASVYRRGMKYRAALVGCLATMSSCGPETAIEPAELDEVCGEASAFRVLELEPDEHLRWVPPLRIGDRVLYLISKLAPIEADDSYAEVLGTTVWATGPCGESPVQLATGISDLFTVEAWPDVPLGCVEATGDVVALDPTGAREPHVVFKGVADTFRCGLRWTPHGVVSVSEHDEELGALLLHPYPADPYTETAMPTTLLDPMRMTPSGRSGPSYRGWTMQAFDDFVLAVSGDDTLVRIELADGTTTPLQSSVWGFDASPTGEYVVWQGTTFTSDDIYAPVGEIFLRDVAVGTDALLAETSIRHSWFPARSAEDGVIPLTLGVRSESPVRLFWLPELESIDLSPESYVSAPLDAERWLVGSTLDARLEVVNPRKGEKRRLIESAGRRWRIGADALGVHQVRQCCIDGDQRDEGPVWRVPLDGSEPQQLVPRATRFLGWQADGRIVTAIDIDSQLLGTLIVVDTATQEERRIAGRVSVNSLDLSRAAEDGTVTFSVSDGKRSGVYLARLPAHTSDRRATFGPTAEPLEVDVLPGPDGRSRIRAGWVVRLNSGSCGLLGANSSAAAEARRAAVAGREKLTPAMKHIPYAGLGGLLGFVVFAAVTCYAHPDYGCVGRSCGGNAEIAGLTEGGPVGGVIGVLVGWGLALRGPRDRRSGSQAPTSTRPSPRE